MCGIAGIYAYGPGSAPAERAELLAMRESMQRRGPDGEGLWIAPHGRAGLAHRRLSIIDLSKAGAQPMSTPDGRLWIIFNGEIYNFRELRAELEKRGHRFRSTSDTEVLLGLYLEHGADMVRHLRGMFAFGIWDEQQRTLFLARDPFGIKPLYYSDAHGTFRFASQVKALLAGCRVDTSPDPAGHAGFFPGGCTRSRSASANMSAPTATKRYGRAKRPLRTARSMTCAGLKRVNSTNSSRPSWRRWTSLRPTA